MLILFSMSKATPAIHPKHARQLRALGARLRNARLRRKLSQAHMAERVGVTIPTLRKLEYGDPTTSLAAALRALQVLGMAADTDRLAADDELGRELQDSALKPTRRRLAS